MGSRLLVLPKLRRAGRRVKMKGLLLLLLATAVASDDKAPLDAIIEINDRISSRFSLAGENDQPELLEGDIVMTRSLQTDISNLEYAAKNNISKFDAIANRAWVNGRIPYTFSRGFSQRGRQMVRLAVADYNKYTCIKFVPRTRERSYVTFFHGSGCYSYIGQQGGPQRISLAHGCLQKGVVIHEMMHCAGFYHEQSRIDRDRYISIQWQNIRGGVEYNFKKYRPGEASTLGAGYDKKSVMHYGNYAFSKNGRKTIISRSNPSERLGQRRGFSTIDIQQLNRYYKCSGTTKPTRGPTTTSCKDSYVFCRVLSGYCSHSWVARHCKKACNKCAKPKPKPKP